MKTLKQITEELVQVRARLDNLYNEKSGCCNRERYNEIIATIHIVDKQFETVRKEFRNKIAEECGIPASGLCCYNVKDFL